MKGKGGKYILCAGRGTGSRGKGEYRAGKYGDGGEIGIRRNKKNEGSRELEK